MLCHISMCDSVNGAACVVPAALWGEKVFFLGSFLDPLQALQMVVLCASRDYRSIADGCLVCTQRMQVNRLL